MKRLASEASLSTGATILTVSSVWFKPSGKVQVQIVR